MTNENYNIDDEIQAGFNALEASINIANENLDEGLINDVEFRKTINEVINATVNDVLTSITDKLHVTEYVTKHKELSKIYKDRADSMVSFDISKLTAKNKYQSYLKSLNRERKNKVMTGFTQFDDEIGGIFSGLTIITALSSLGKSSMCSQLADQIAMAGNKVIYLNAEMQDSHIFSKSITRLSGKYHQLSFYDILNIKDCQFMPKVDSFVNSIEDYNTFSDNIVITQASKFWNTELRKYIKELTKINNDKPPVVFIDYLQILPSIADSRANGNELVAINEIISELKNIIQETGAYIIAISSLSRASYERGITMSSLKGSGNLEYSAEMILSIEPSRDDTCDGMPIFDNKKGVFNMDLINTWKRLDNKTVSLRVLKNRMGITGYSSNLTFESSKAKFTEIISNPHHPYHS